ncbi:hypothetical protein U1Q18_003262 [Sarracenia purpurea var. burkii]
MEGYMDPEYYMTQQLSEKSDVYSFGVVLLELVTARAPISRGKHIVREVKEAMDRSKDQNDLHEIFDPVLGNSPVGLEKLVDLAMSCVRDLGADRPMMGEVVREVENIIQLASLKLNTKLPITYSSSFEGATEASIHYSPDTTEDFFDYSAGSFPFHLEHH